MIGGVLTISMVERTFEYKRMDDEKSRFVRSIPLEKYSRSTHNEELT